jgi:MFS family permease
VPTAAATQTEQGTVRSVGSPGSAVPRRPLTGLALADLISTTGTEMTAVALPWFVLTTTGSPARMGVVLAAEYAGLTLLGLAGARLATYTGPRRLMLSADLTRAALIAAIPLLYWAGALSFPVILAISVCIGGFFPAYQSSSQLIVASLTGGDQVQLTRLGGLLSAVNESASFAGPAVAGVLIAALGPAPVLIIDAGSYLCAFALVGVLARGTGRAGPAGGDTSALAGLRFLWRSRPLRVLIAGVGLLSAAFAAMVATIPVLAVHHGGATEAGWLLAAYGAGSVAGGLISSRARRAGGRTATLAVAGLAVAAWGLAVPGPAWRWGLAIAATGIATGLFYPRFFAAMTTAAPAELRAQVLASVTVAISAPGPLGFLAAGLISGHSTFASRLLVGAIATVAAAVIVLSPHVPSAPGEVTLSM